MWLGEGSPSKTYDGGRGSSVFVNVGKVHTIHHKYIGYMMRPTEGSIWRIDISHALNGLVNLL